jgi:hypothetical protein
MVTFSTSRRTPRQARPATFQRHRTPTIHGLVDQLNITVGGSLQETRTHQTPKVFKISLGRDRLAVLAHQFGLTPADVKIGSGDVAIHEPPRPLAGGTERYPDPSRSQFSEGTSVAATRGKAMQHTGCGERTNRDKVIALDKPHADLGATGTRTNPDAEFIGFVGQQHDGRAEYLREEVPNPASELGRGRDADVRGVPGEARRPRAHAVELSTTMVAPASQFECEPCTELERRCRDFGLIRVGRDREPRRAAPSEPVARVEASGTETLDGGDDGAEVDLRVPTVQHVLVLDAD